MIKRLFLSVLCLAGLSVSAQDTPTMGWSSWNTFALNINDDIIKGQADAMVSTGLRDAGYKYINIDDGYFGGRRMSDGQLLIHPVRFPNGLRGLVAYIHSKGLKAGIYSDAGRNTCGNFWGNDTIAHDVGLYGHDQQDADFFFKTLDFDFIKVDFCGGTDWTNFDKTVLDEKERYTAISNAIKATGKKGARLNVCRWDYPGTWVSDVALSWRTTHDIADDWASVADIIHQNLYLSAYSSPGHYNDMDMLEVGRSLSADEDATHFGLWCIMNSPLLIGCDLRNIKQETLILLKKEELIALNQDPLYQQAYVAALVNGCYLLVKDLEELNGTKRAFAVYNPNDAQKTVQVSFADLDMGGLVKMYDAFMPRNKKEATGSFEVTVPAHGVRIYVAEAEQRLERTRYEAETGYISTYQEIKNNQAEKTGIYETADYCSCGYKAGWLGYSEANALEWRNVYSKNGGEYNLTIGFICGESRNIAVSVNGEKVKTLSCNSGGWQKVGTKTLTIQLQPGQNNIRLSNASNWMPDIDYIDVVSTAPAGISKTVNSKLSNSQIYDLSGRKVTTPRKGVNIINGRKVTHK